MEGRPVAVVGVDLSRPAARQRLALLSGGDVVGRAIRERGILIGEPLSSSASVTVGDRVEIEGPKGPVRLPVSGIYRDYTQGGSVTMDLGLMAENPGSRRPHQHRASTEAGRGPGSGRGGRSKAGIRAAPCGCAATAT